MWFFHQLRPESPAYHIPIAFRLTGPLYVPALDAAFGTLSERHAILRSRVRISEGVPTLEFDPQDAPPLQEVDLSGFPADERDAVLQARLNAEVRRPFDLTRDRPLRCALFRLAAEVRVLVIVVHHIASDLWSGQILLRELGSLYDGFVTGVAPALPVLPIQYGDYAAWERRWLSGSGPEESLAFWKRKLAGASGVLDLPADFPRPAAFSFAGAVVRATLPAELADELQVLSREQGVTLFMTLLAAWQVLLGRLAQQDDVVVGIPTAGRSQRKTEGLIGLFVNTLAIRADLSADPSFRAFLAQTKEATLSALSHQDVPFDRVVEELRPLRSANQSPLVQVMFTLQGAVESTFSLPSVATDPLAIDPGASRFDLTLVAVPRGEQIDLMLEYSTELYAEESARRFLEQFGTLLEEIVADPDRAISKLPILSSGERQRILVEWNRTAQAFAGPGCLHELVENQARLTPHQVAVIAGDVRTTYRQLDAQANRIARQLRAGGISREARVGVFLDRGPELIPALLGVLKSGAAYVPLDPNYPADRLAFALQDSNAEVLLTTGALRDQWPAFAGRIVRLDEVPAADGDSGAPVAAAGSNLAYVIYTSGSTGQPKGVAIEHRNAVALVEWAQTVFNARELDGVLAATSIGFDLSLFEIFVPLSCGGKVILAANVLALGDLAARSEVRLINTVPSALAELLRAGAIPPGVETINLAGEPVSQELVRQLYAQPGVKRVYDLYGPTETTTYSTFALRTPQGRPTIGRPIANSEVYVLDRHLQPAPIGVVGEIFIGGAGVARGYLNRPALTAERFIRNPFVADPQARLYQTGDLGRYRSDGQLECVGRTDHQVKLRGFRIEMGEIESQLRLHPEVADVCVCAREDRPGEKRLVAYWVPKAATRPTPADWRRWLTRTLPEAFIPAAWVSLPQLPRTPNGKIDRRALPVPDSENETRLGCVLPRDTVERQLAKIWEEALGVRPIGVHDRFFDLGGHSLLAVRLTIQIEQQMGRRLSLAALLQSPTIAQLADLFRPEAATCQRSEASLVTLNGRGDRAPIFLVHGMGGGALWGYTNLARHLDPDQPVYGFEASETRLENPPESVEMLARRYVRELRQKQPTGPYRLGGYCFGGNIAFEMARQLEAAGETVDRLILISAWPANSGHDRMRWTPGGVAGFLVNLFGWLLRFRDWNPRARAQFLRWKIATYRKRLFRGAASERDGSSEVEMLVDLSEIPEGERRLWAAHLTALRGYRPGAIKGRVSLMRTKGYPMFSSFEPSHGWADYARGGVAVRTVPGRHATLLSDPHVAAVARVIQEELN
jgi:amino acid adenylation domain-containing protein